MPNIKHIVLIIAIGIVGVCFAGYVITHSLWFLSGFVPESSGIVWASQGNHPFIQLVNSQAGLIGLDLEQDGIDPQDFSHLILAKTVSSTHLVGISQSIFGTSSIQQNGWHVQSFGPFTSAEKGLGTDVLTAKVLLSRSWRGIRQLISHSREGISPIGIIHIAKNSIPLADTTYDAIIKQEKQGIRATIKHPHGQIAPPITLEKNDQNIPTSGLKFALSGKMLAHIPNNLQSASLGKLMENLHITRKQTDLARMFEQASFIAGVSNDKETGLAIMGDTAIIAPSFQRIAAQEEGYYHPERGTFRLPDGSVGFELRPGKPSALWSQVNESCGYYNGQEHQWWVCNNSTISSLGTSQQVAEMLLANYDQHIWMVTFGKDIVPENLQQAIKTLNAIGTSEETQITIE